MQYKNKLITLSAICGGLLLIYILSFVFDPEKNAARKASWTILSEKDRALIEKIEIFSGNDLIVLEKNNDTAVVSGANASGSAKTNAWFVNFEDKLFPARPSKIDDLLDDLTTKGTYSVRSASESSFEKFGLDVKSAKHIALRGANNATILDLFAGNTDTSGREIYVRKSGETKCVWAKMFFRPI